MYHAFVDIPQEIHSSQPKKRKREEDDEEMALIKIAMIESLAEQKQQSLRIDLEKFQRERDEENHNQFRAQEASKHNRKKSLALLTFPMEIWHLILFGIIERCQPKRHSIVRIDRHELASIVRLGLICRFFKEQVLPSFFQRFSRHFMMVQCMHKLAESYIWWVVRYVFIPGDEPKIERQIQRCCKCESAYWISLCRKEIENKKHFSHFHDVYKMDILKCPCIKNAIVQSKYI
jgi:hypothetical protein